MSVRAALALVWVVSSVLSCAAEDRPAEGSERIHLRVVRQPYLPYAPLFVGEAEGDFEREGLDVEFISMASTELAVPLLIDGSVDVLPGHLTPGILNAIARGEPMRIAAPTASISSAGCSSIAVVVARRLRAGPDAAVRPETVRRVSVNPQIGMRYLADRAFAHVGLRFDSLDAVDVPPGVRASALREGQLDAVLAGEPFLTRIVSSGAAEPWIPLGDVLPQHQIGYLFFGERLLTEDVEAGRRFLAGWRRASARLAEGRSDRMVALLSDATGEDEEILRTACWPFQAETPPIDEAGLDVFQRWLLDRGWLDRALAIDRLVDRRFLAAPEAPTDSSEGARP